MDVKRCRLFLILAEDLHFGRAARRAGLTQSALSTQIKRLEDEAGAPLFERTTRAVALTAVGRGFVAEARAVLDRVEDARQALRALASGKRAVLRIALTTVAMLSDAPRLIGGLRAGRPDLEIQLRELGTVDQESALAAGEIDVGFLHPPLDHPDLQVVERDASRFVALAARDAAPDAPGGRFADSDAPASWRDALAEPIVFFGRRRAPRLYDAFIAAAHAEGVAPVIVAEARSFLSAVACAASGVGVAIVPEELARTAPPQVAVRALPGCPIRLHNGVAYRSADAAAPVLETWRSLHSADAHGAARRPGATA